ncbi:uncharacterized protein PHACADRAFT_31552 [Phanerochaete carnosa HHB-10118-sp]|uniref:Uncharacterized protein n=1 Tax=Phanerochaete carnosa (strain HHB-10118-sp) TaxID=650164 RepID=K5VYP5_PHACS|nr:uncharacterized protein PHACADRAFT_31552 [Phanerochaete carnosa HHB-10118-sp]EKM51734.1 hypothetical protein PHACADRAFT_31552 [Phanerochaete carnosa HHB-10118-sp]
MTLSKNPKLSAMPNIKPYESIVGSHNISVAGYVEDEGPPPLQAADHNTYTSAPSDNGVNGDEMPPSLEPAVPVKDHPTAMVIIDPVSMLTMKDLQDVLLSKDVLFDKSVEVMNLIMASELLCMVACAGVAMCNLYFHKPQIRKVQVVGCQRLRDVPAARGFHTDIARVPCVAAQPRRVRTGHDTERVRRVSDFLKPTGWHSAGRGVVRRARTRTDGHGRTGQTLADRTDMDGTWADKGGRTLLGPSEAYKFDNWRLTFELKLTNIDKLQEDRGSGQ